MMASKARHFGDRDRSTFECLLPRIAHGLTVSANSPCRKCSIGERTLKRADDFVERFTQLPQLSSTPS
jgi:hypothetical protein